MNIYDTYFMLAAVEELPLQRSFFRDRYFPTDTMLDIFGTSKVFVEYREGSKKLAPFVVPRIGGISILREGSELFELEPANISLKRSLTIDDLKQRGFGEAFDSQLTPADREQVLLMEDLVHISNRITLREEWMSIETILNNGCLMLHITDREEVRVPVEARYYTGDDNPTEYTPATPWTSGDTSWRRDIRAMWKRLSNRGLPAVDLVVSEDVGDFIEDDPWVKEILDNRRMDYGHIAPEELTDGTTFLGTLNFGGKRLNIIICGETYEDENGNDVPFMPSGTLIVTAPKCGHTIYGGVTQMEADKNFHTTPGKRVPKLDADTKHDTKEVRLTSKPLMAPLRKDPWMVAKNVFN